MVETVKTRAALLAEMADGGDNTAEEVRNGIVSMWTPDWVRHLNHRLPDETPHTDDDFFTSDTSADYTEITPTGTADWGISNGLLGAIVDDQATGDVAGFLKEITSASAPMTIEARITAWVPWVDNPHFGIVFTDGVAATSNLAGVGLLGSDASGQAGGVFWTSGTFTVGSTGTALTFAQGHGQFTVYLRVIWKSANTWQIGRAHV